MFDIFLFLLNLYVLNYFFLKKIDIFLKLHHLPFTESSEMCKSIKNVFLNLVRRFFHNLIYSINPPWDQCTLNSTRTVLLKNRNTVEHTWRAIKATVVFSSMFCLIQFDCIVDLLQTVFLFWPSNISFWQISKCSYFVTNSKDNYTREKTPKATCHKSRQNPKCHTPHRMIYC